MKARATALVLTVLFAFLVVGAFALVIFGGHLETWVTSTLGESQAWVMGFAILRWVVISLALLLGFAFIYYLGPDVEQKFSFITPGSLMGVVLLAAASLGFKFYVDHFWSIQCYLWKFGSCHNNDALALYDRASHPLRI